MEKMFFLGLAFGAVAGAVIVANSYKMRSFVKKGQAEVLDRVNEIVDERMDAWQECAKEQDAEKKARK